jgi:hypothetical protein
MSDRQAIADRVEIEALRGEFTDTIMTRDNDRFACLFTHDGAWRIPYINVELVGREEVRAGIERMQALWEYFVQTVHPGTIRLEGDTAVGRAYIWSSGACATAARSNTRPEPSRTPAPLPGPAVDERDRQLGRQRRSRVVQRHLQTRDPARPTPSPTNTKDGWPRSDGCTVTTPSAATPGSHSNPRSPTNAPDQHRLRWPRPHKPRVQDQGSSPQLDCQQRTGLSLDGLAEWINPIVAGWMNYFGRFYRSALHQLLQRINTYLMRWARKKYRRLRSFKRFKAWWTGILDREPGLFKHWTWAREFEWTR